MREDGKMKKNRYTGNDFKWTLAYRRLEKSLPESAMHRWVDDFRLLEADDKKAVIFYSGKAELAEFTDQYESVFADSLSWAFGRPMTVEFRQTCSEKKENTKEKQKERKKEKKKDRRKDDVKETQKVDVKETASEIGEKTAVRKQKRGVGVKAAPVFLAVILLCAALSVGVVLWNVNVTNRTFRETFYQIGSVKVNGNLRIIQLSDLHNSSYGIKNDSLVERITKLKPDLIVMTGDMIEQKDASIEEVLELCKQLTEVAPVCYIYGEGETARLFGEGVSEIDYDKIFRDEAGGLKEPVKEDALSVRLEEMGVHVLWNESVTVEAGGQAVDVYGVMTAEPESFRNYAAQSYESFLEDDGKRNLKLLAVHKPDLFETSEEEWADLILCGHTNGGTMRVPRLGGLYVEDHGLFPELFYETAYIRGAYRAGESQLIVSSGLTNRELLRVNNQPELVIIDVNRY